MTGMQKSEARSMIREALKAEQAPTFTIAETLKLQAEDAEKDDIRFMMESNGK